MNYKEFQFRMNKFVNSYEFLNKNVSYCDNRFIDKNTNLTLVVKVDNLDNLPKYDNPVIYISDNEEVLNILTNSFNSSKWSVERINSLTGEEFDYAYLRQCNLLGISKVI